MSSINTVEIPSEITIAADTEFQGAHTLTIQVACRLLDNAIALQLYKSPAVPFPSTSFDPKLYLPNATYARFYEDLQHRPIREIYAGLSPGAVLRDLLNADIEVLSRAEGQLLIQRLEESDSPPLNVTKRNSKGNFVIQQVALLECVHFQPADFMRLRGTEFLRRLIHPHYRDPGDIFIDDGKRIKFVDRRLRNDYQNPVVEYLRLPDGRLFELRHATIDTRHPFGPASLDAHCKTFLGCDKSDLITSGEKSRMAEVFREKTDIAFGYAASDAVNTLLLYEQMSAEHKRIYQSFGHANDTSPPLRPTQGARNADFIKHTAYDLCNGSTLISR